MLFLLLRTILLIIICFIYLFVYQLLRRWRGGSIEPHPTEKALIVNYKLEAAVFGEPGDPMLEEKKVIIQGLIVLEMNK